MPLDNLLIGGGIASVVVAGWNHVKSMYARISGVLIETVVIDSNSSYAVTSYLLDNYKRLPPIKHFYSYTMKQISPKKFEFVPFYVHNPIGFNYNKFSFLFVKKLVDGNVEISYFRKIVNFQNILKEIAIKDNRERIIFYKNNKSNDFRIENVLGREANSDPPHHRELKGSKEVEISESVFHPTLTSLSWSKYGSFLYPDLHTNSDWVGNSYENLFLEDSAHKIINECSKWMETKEWYEERKIPWKRGILLYGKPGCGKSSLAVAIAKDLGLPVYNYHLSTLSDREFIENWERMLRPCMVLMEDFDSIFDGRKSLVDTQSKKLTFETILNMISGINQSWGILLIITTNDISKIDPAIGISVKEGSTLSTRPGRIDRVIELGLMSKENRLKMANVILKDWPEAIDDLVMDGEGYTPAQFQEMCIQTAFNLIAKDEKSMFNKPTQYVYSLSNVIKII